MESAQKHFLSTQLTCKTHFTFCTHTHTHTKQAVGHKAEAVKIHSKPKSALVQEFRVPHALALQFFSRNTIKTKKTKKIAIKKVIMKKRLVLDAIHHNEYAASV